MKTLFLFAFLSILHLVAHAQGNVQFSISVVTRTGQPVAGVSIVAMETATLQTVNAKSDANGHASMALNGGKEWSISVGEIKKIIRVAGVPDQLINMNKSFVYDLDDFKRKKLQDKTRSNSKFKIVPQTVGQ